MSQSASRLGRTTNTNQALPVGGIPRAPPRTQGRSQSPRSPETHLRSFVQSFGTEDVDTNVAGMLTRTASLEEQVNHFETIRNNLDAYSMSLDTERTISNEEATRELANQFLTIVVSFGYIQRPPRVAPDVEVKDYDARYELDGKLVIVNLRHGNARRPKTLEVVIASKFNTDALHLDYLHEMGTMFIVGGHNENVPIQITLGKFIMNEEQRANFDRFRSVINATSDALTRVLDTGGAFFPTDKIAISWLYRRFTGEQELETERYINEFF
jgi:hypothetical protein